MEDLLNFSFQSHSHSPKRNHYDCGPSSHQGSQASYSRGHGDSGSDSPSAGPVSPQQQASNLVKRGGWMKEEILDCRRRQQGTGVLGQRVRQTDKTAGLRKRLEIGVQDSGHVSGKWLAFELGNSISQNLSVTVSMERKVREVEPARELQGGNSSLTPGTSPAANCSNSCHWQMPLASHPQCSSQGWSFREDRESDSMSLELGVASVFRLPLVRFDHLVTLFWGSHCVSFLSVQTYVCI